MGDAGDFHELTDVERRIVELRLGLGETVRAGREAKGTIQTDLAEAIGSSQSEVAMIEAAAQHVAVDLMPWAPFTVDGKAPEELVVGHAATGCGPIESSRNPKAKAKAYSPKPGGGHSIRRSASG